MAQQTTLIPLAARTSTLIVDSDLDLGAYAINGAAASFASAYIENLLADDAEVVMGLQCDRIDVDHGQILNAALIKTPYDSTIPWQPGDEASTRDFLPGPYDSYYDATLRKIVWMIVDYPGMPAESRCRIQCQAIVIGDSASKPVYFRKDGVDIPGGNFIASKSLQTFYVDVDIQHGSSLEVWSHGDSDTKCRITNMRMMAVTAVPTRIPV